MSLGMIGALGSGYCVAEVLRSTANQSLLFTDLLQKPPIYYVFHATQAVFVILATLMAFVAAKMAKLPIGTYSIPLLALASVFIVVKGYEPGVIFTTFVMQ